VNEATFGVEAIAMTMRFGDFTALDNVELKVRPGSFHALLGENGAGKSTLMNVLYGLYQPDEGEILIDDEPVTFTGQHYDPELSDVFFSSAGLPVARTFPASIAIIQSHCCASSI